MLNRIQEFLPVHSKFLAFPKDVLSGGSDSVTLGMVAGITLY